MIKLHNSNYKPHKTFSAILIIFNFSSTGGQLPVTDWTASEFLHKSVAHSFTDKFPARSQHMLFYFIYLFIYYYYFFFLDYKFKHKSKTGKFSPFPVLKKASFEDICLWGKNDVIIICFLRHEHRVQQLMFTNKPIDQEKKRL